VTEFRQIAPDFWVAPQLGPEDFAAAKAMGIRTVINNRPEAEPGAMASAEAEAAARAAGLDYAFLPVISGGLRFEDVEAFGETLAANAGPFLAFCRTGTRSTHLWALDAAKRLPPDEIVAAAAQGGYDLAALRPVLARIHAQHAERG
jgi:uncharacterized protein (TIGR01244 family)